MSSLPPGWYKDPADTTTQRYWDGEGWIGDAIPADAVPPAGPPKIKTPPSTPPPTPTKAPATKPTSPAAPAAAPGRVAPTQFQAPVTLTGELAYPYSRVGAQPRPHQLMLAGVGSRFVA